jgi:hypothetical protein
LLADSPKEFARKVVRVLNDGKLAEKLSKNGLSLIKYKYSYKNSEQILDKIYRWGKIQINYLKIPKWGFCSERWRVKNEEG